MSTMLDFYRQHSISPVKQDVTDLSAHFQRRAFLYRSLGLAPALIAGKRVLEVGPGSGDNALYTLSLQPSHYVALEPNECGATAMRGRLAVEVLNQQIEDFPIGELFDLVLCEGLIGLCGGSPTTVLQAALRHVKVGGVLVATTIDPISDCAEAIRRAMAHRLVDKTQPLQQQVETLKPVFAPHLATLQGMTRFVDDWIVDNLLNPASIGPTFSIDEACRALDGQCEVLGSSPRCLTDWRWYKQAPAGTRWCLDAYWANAHILMDYRAQPLPRPDWENRHLLTQCARVRAAVRDFEQQPRDASTSAITDALFDLTNLPRVTMLALREARHWLMAPPDGDILAQSQAFGPWFGRGQQYLSFVRVQ